MGRDGAGWGWVGRGVAGWGAAWRVRGGGGGVSAAAAAVAEKQHRVALRGARWV